MVSSFPSTRLCSKNIRSNTKMEYSTTPPIRPGESSFNLGLAVRHRHAGAAVNHTRSCVQRQCDSSNEHLKCRISLSLNNFNPGLHNFCLWSTSHTHTHTGFCYYYTLMTLPPCGFVVGRSLHDQRLFLSMPRN